MVIKQKGEAQNMGKLSILNLRTFEMNKACDAVRLPVFAWVWTPDSDKLAFFSAGSIWVYSRTENKLEEAWRLSQKKLGLSFDWLADGGRMALIEGTPEQGSVVIIGRDFREEKRVSIPKGLLGDSTGLGLWGLDDKVLLAGGNSGVWRLDLKTDEWKKVY